MEFLSRREQTHQLDKSLGSSPRLHPKSIKNQDRENLHNQRKYLPQLQFEIKFVYCKLQIVHELHKKERYFSPSKMHNYMVYSIEYECMYVCMYLSIYIYIKYKTRKPKVDLLKMLGRMVVRFDLQWTELDLCCDSCW